MEDPDQAGAHGRWAPALPRHEDACPPGRNGRGRVSRKTARCAVAGFAVLAIVAVPVIASASEPAPIQINLLGQERGEFTDEVAITVTMRAEGEHGEQLMHLDDASHLVMAEVVMQPGAVLPWHTHPAVSLSVIEQGELIYVTQDCVERHYPAGTANVDSGEVHTAYNPSETEDMVMFTMMMGAPASGSLSTPVDQEKSDALDEKCGIQR